MEDVYYDLVDKVKETLRINGLHLILGEAGPSVHIFHDTKNERYYRISFTSRDPDGVTVVERPVDIYAGLKKEPRSIEQNDQIISRLEEELARLNLIRH